MYRRADAKTHTDATPDLIRHHRRKQTHVRRPSASGLVTTLARKSRVSRAAHTEQLPGCEARYLVSSSEGSIITRPLRSVRSAQTVVVAVDPSRPYRIQTPVRRQRGVTLTCRKNIDIARMCQQFTTQPWEMPSISSRIVRVGRNAATARPSCSQAQINCEEQHAAGSRVLAYRGHRSERLLRPSS